VCVDPAPNRNVRRSANASQLTIDGLARVHTDRAPFSAPAPTLDEVAELPADVQAADTGQQTGAEVVRQPCTRSQHCLRSRHDSPHRCDEVDSAMKTSNLTVLGQVEVRLCKSTPNG
jgi:hypothetical protein